MRRGSRERGHDGLRRRGTSRGGKKKEDRRRTRSGDGGGGRGIRRHGRWRERCSSCGQRVLREWEGINECRDSVAGSRALLPPRTFCSTTRFHLAAKRGESILPTPTATVHLIHFFLFFPMLSSLPRSILPSLFSFVTRAFIYFPDDGTPRNPCSISSPTFLRGGSTVYLYHRTAYLRAGGGVGGIVHFWLVISMTPRRQSTRGPISNLLSSSPTPSSAALNGEKATGSSLRVLHVVFIDT